MTHPAPDSVLPGESLLDGLRRIGFVEVGGDERIAIDLRYASANNFLGRPLYIEFDRLFLHPIAAAKLRVAADVLASRSPGHRLLVLDGLRPNSIQRKLWAAVEHGPFRPYVADPAIGSIHAFGLAVDLTLLAPDGCEVDMGTRFDDFSPLAEPRREAEFLRSGALTNKQFNNRRLLRDVMTSAGFLPLAIEWWHFDALPAEQVRARFALVE